MVHAPATSSTFKHLGKTEKSLAKMQIRMLSTYINSTEERVKGYKKLKEKQTVGEVGL